MVFINKIFSISFILAISISSVLIFSQTRSRADWGGALVDVTHSGNEWIITGQKHKVIFNDSDFTMRINAGPVNWSMAASEDNDMIVKSRGEEFNLMLASAGKIIITKYDAGYKTGIKIRLEQFHDNGMLNKGLNIDLTVVLTICLEGEDEDLVCDAVAIEHEAKLRQLDWPKEVDTHDANYTALNNVRGNLLPCNWPKPYHPYGNVPSGQEDLIKSDKSYIQSNLIECWSMSWWGFQKR